MNSAITIYLRNGIYDDSSANRKVLWVSCSDITKNICFYYIHSKDLLPVLYVGSKEYYEIRDTSYITTKQLLQILK